MSCLTTSQMTLLKNLPSGMSSIDLYLIRPDGKRELWEVKSPEEPKEGPKPGRELAFVERNLRKAVKQFRSQYDEATGGKLNYKGPVRVVFIVYWNTRRYQVQLEEMTPVQYEPHPRSWTRKRKSEIWRCGFS